MKRFPSDPDAAVPHASGAGSTLTTLRSLGLAWLAAALVPLLPASVISEGAPLFTRVGAPVSVPAEVADHVMFVSVMINDQGPFRVMVDTGCSLSVVSPQVADAVGALVADDLEDSSAVAVNGLGDPTDVQRVVLTSINLGGVRFEGVQAIVADSFTGISALDGHGVDAILGYPLFRDVFLALDFPHQRLLLGSAWPANIPAIRATLPVVEHADVPYVQVQLQGKPLEVMIDTGANQALQVTAGLAPSFDWKTPPRAGPLIAVVGEIAREMIGRLAGDLQIGDIRQIAPTAVVTTGPSSLGLRSLEKFCIVFHQNENRMWLCGSDPAPIAPSAERSIGLSLYSEQGGWRVAGIIPGSPAEDAHLAAGTLVTQLEGRPAISWTRDQIQKWIDSHAHVALVVADLAGERALTLPVWDLVP